MQAKDIILDKCTILSEMLDTIYCPANHDYEEVLIEINDVISEVEEIDGILQLGILADKLCYLTVNDWRGYSSNAVYLFAIYVKFLVDTMNQEAWEIEIDGMDQYRIYDSNETRDIGNIFYSSADDSHNEMILINCKEIDQIEPFLKRIDNIQEIIIKTIYLMDMKTDYESMFVTKESVDEAKRKSKIEYLKLFAVLKGKTFHTTPAIARHEVRLPVQYNEEIEYAQYAEIIDVMNEYNAQNHIVDKYIKLYQVIENFMFKKSICDLCALRNYKKLTLRDFKSMSEKLSQSEKDALFKFAIAALDVVVDGKSFEDRLMESWDNCFVASGKLNVAETFVQKLAITNKDGSFKSVLNMETNPDKRLTKMFCEMIYATRCSIVHNKVNEYHITYMNLDEDIKWVMEFFLLPNMMDLSYGLMLNSNNVVMYQQNCLSLF